MMHSSQKSMGRRIIGALLIVTFTVGGFFAGIVVAPRLNPEGALAATLTVVLGEDALQPPANLDVTPLWKAWHILDERFVGASTTSKVTDEERLWGAIQGVAAAHGDPHTVFLPPVENKIFNEDISGSFAGVGMEVGLRDGIVTVVAPLKGSPSEKAGLKAGDRILAISGTSTQNMSIEVAVSHIRGEKDTEVTLLVYTESDEAPREVTIVRDTIVIPTIDTEMREDGIFVISLYNFSATSPNDFRAALREFVLSGSDQLILDLRNNPGGFLEAAVDMASWFLPTGKVVTEEYAGEDQESRFHRSKGYNIFAGKDLKMVILVNEGSASASEILAGALQEYGVATVIGTNTFGKGSVQELLTLTSEPETSLKITIAQWLTPNGKSISDGGLTPDLEAPWHATTTPEGLSEKEKEAYRAVDRQMEKAVQHLRGQ